MWDINLILVGICFTLSYDLQQTTVALLASTYINSIKAYTKAKSFFFFIHWSFLRHVITSVPDIQNTLLSLHFNGTLSVFVLNVFFPPNALSQKSKPAIWRFYRGFVNIICLIFIYILFVKYILLHVYQQPGKQNINNIINNINNSFCKTFDSNISANESRILNHVLSNVLEIYAN